MRSIMLASVVDLPEPVGPVTSTMPRCTVSQSFTTLDGSPRSSRAGSLTGIVLNTAETPSI